MGFTRDLVHDQLAARVGQLRQKFCIFNQILNWAIEHNSNLIQAFLLILGGKPRSFTRMFVAVITLRFPASTEFGFETFFD